MDSTASQKMMQDW